MEKKVDYQIYDLSGGTFAITVPKREAVRLENGMEYD